MSDRGSSWPRIFRALKGKARTRTAREQAAAAPDIDPARLRSSLAIQQSLGEAELALGQSDHATAEHAVARAVTQGAHVNQTAPLYARIAMQRGQAYRALHLIESADPADPQVRLITNLVRLSAGLRQKAELDLTDWLRETDCPAAARTLRAWLWLAEDSDEAAESILSDSELENDPIAQQLRTTIAMRRGQTPHKRNITDLLHRFSDQILTDRWAQSLGLGRRRQAEDVPLDRVLQLADEITRHPTVIRTLVEAQQYRPEPDRIALIRRALVRIVSDLPEPIVAIEAIAKLAQLAGDSDEAYRWARRGLNLAPYNANLAMLASHIESQVNQLTNHAHTGRDALESVAEQQPDWPDVQLALAERYRNDDMPVRAVEHLYRWLIRDPQQPAASAMLREMAA